MSKIRNTGITNKQAFWDTYHVATATQNLRVLQLYSMDMFTYYGHINRSRSENTILAFG